MGIRDEEEVGVIQKIQGKTGCLLLLLGFALLAFILTEFINARSSVARSGNNPIGEIAGQSIDYTEYSTRVEKEIQDIQLANPNVVMNKEYRKNVEDQVWSQMIQEQVIAPQHEELGIVITEEELEYYTLGPEPHPRIIQAFPMPDGKPGFNRQRFVQFLNEDIQNDEDVLFQWVKFFEEPIKREIVGSKYSALLKSTVYTTKLEAQANFDDENKELSAVAVGLPYLSIADSTLSYDDDDLKAHLKEHEEDYQQKSSRDIEMAVLEVIPTKEDTNAVVDWAKSLVAHFENADDDSAFVDLQGSETLFDTTFKSPGSIQNPEINEAVFSAEVGAVLGPFIDGGKVSLYKVSEETEDSVYSMRAEHILVAVEGPERSDSVAALAKARALIAELKAGTKNWNEEAKSNFDGTGLMNGDLGWVQEGIRGYTPMQEKFKRELFRRQEGDYFVVLSNIGAHVGHVTGGKTKRKVKYAIMDKSIAPSSTTDQATMRLAAEILYQAQNNEDFGEVVESQNLVLQSADLVEESATTVSGIKDAKDLVRWMYEDGRKEGDISDIVELENIYIVAKLITIREEGTADFEDVKETLEVSYKEKLKSDMLSKQLTDAMQGASTPDELATKLNTLARSIPAQRFAAQQVTGMGRDLGVQGAIFGVEPNKFSKPVKGNTGVFVVFVNGEVEPKNNFNEDVSKSILNNKQLGTIDQQVLEALRKNAEIIDQRYKFF